MEFTDEELFGWVVKILSEQRQRLSIFNVKKVRTSDIALRVLIRVVDELCVFPLTSPKVVCLQKFDASLLW